MARLEDIPDELFDQICQLINEHVGLSGLSRASKRYHQVATPHLYKIALRHNFDVQHCGRLGLAILRNPDLMRYITGVFWLEGSEHYPPSKAEAQARRKFSVEAHSQIPDPIPIIIPGALPLVDDVITKEGITDSGSGNTYDAQHKHGNWLATASMSQEHNPNDQTNSGIDILYFKPKGLKDAVNIAEHIFPVRFLEFILTRCENLKSIHIELGRPFDIPNLNLFEDFRRLNSNKGRFSKLEHMAFFHWDTESGFGMDRVFPLLSLTNVTSVKFFKCNSLQDQEDDFRGQQMPSVIKAEFIDSSFSLAELEIVIWLFPNLKTFSYSAANSQTQPFETVTPSSSKMSTALQPLAKTLSSLQINLWDRECYSDEESDSPIEPLGEFEELQHLRIFAGDLGRRTDRNSPESEDLLEPWAHKLPQGLKSLYIVGASTNIKFGLEELARMAGKELPNLENVGVENAEFDWEYIFEGTQVKTDCFQELFDD